MFTLVCEVLLAFYWVFLVVRLVLRSYEKGRDCCRDFWHVYDIVVVVLILLAAVFYTARFLFAQRTVKNFTGDMKAFVNFAHVVFWDNLLATSLGFLAFLVALRILQIFNAAKKVQAILNIFRHCGRDLVWFGLTFWYVFTAFALTGFLLFGFRLFEFHTPFAALKTLFLALIGKSMFVSITTTSPVFAQVFFLLFVMVIVFFTFTLYMSILCGAIDAVVHTQHGDQSDDVIKRLMKKVSHLLRGNRDTAR